MKSKAYTDEVNSLILMSLLKQHGIKKVIASPGSTNHTLVASMQQDEWFEMYSSVDERSAAYIACGLAAESGEPVVITCTEATAARNYGPGLTEAYYRKLPVLAITTTHGADRAGHLHPQSLDHTSLPKDISVYNTFVPICDSERNIKSAVLHINEAILELKHRGGGPSIINLETEASRKYSIEKLPIYRKIDRFGVDSELPLFPDGKVLIFIGAHKLFTKEETDIIDEFCQSRNTVAFCDHTSGYYGKYRVDYSLICSQQSYISNLVKSDVLIHIGEVSGDYFSMQVGGLTKEVWRINEDGVLRDTFGKLKYVFEMSESRFFNYYITKSKPREHIIQKFIDERLEVSNRIQELPFSKIWVAQKLSKSLPKNSTIHFSILGSLRAGNFFQLPNGVTSASNVGGFGIDGATSSLIGASFNNKNKLYYLLTGDLAFFYDLNAIGNRHIGNNVRILLINNGNGTEFRMHWHPCSEFNIDECDKYMSAGGHFGNKSKDLVKNLCQNLGFDYICACTKDEFNKNLSYFTSPEPIEKPLMFEIFTESETDATVVDSIRNLVVDSSNSFRQLKKTAKGILTTVLNPEQISKIKKLIN